MVVVVAWEGIWWGRGHSPFSGASRSGMAGVQLTASLGDTAIRSVTAQLGPRDPGGDPPLDLTVLLPVLRVASGSLLPYPWCGRAWEERRLRLDAPPWDWGRRACSQGGPGCLKCREDTSNAEWGLAA